MRKHFSSFIVIFFFFTNLTSFVLWLGHAQWNVHLTTCSCKIQKQFLLVSIMTITWLCRLSSKYIPIDIWSSCQSFTMKLQMLENVEWKKITSLSPLLVHTINKQSVLNRVKKINKDHYALSKTPYQVVMTLTWAGDNKGRIMRGKECSNMVRAAWGLSPYIRDE